MRVIIAAGGSGGHIFPATAVAEELEKKGVKEIYFVASDRKLDRNILGASRYRSFYLSANPMPFRKDILKWVVFAFKIVSDAFLSAAILVWIRPGRVVAFGGYSSGAISLCAKAFNIPLVIHEQNHAPGRAIMILSNIARKIAVSFPESGQFFPCSSRGRVVLTGNPIRSCNLTDIGEGAMEYLELSGSSKKVLVMGGSQGSSSLNRVASIAASLLKEDRSLDIEFIHLTGAKDHAAIKDFYRDNGINAAVFSFLERMDAAYSAADIAISRSGSAAVFELAYHRKPMILVPYPSRDNNQRTNAAYFAKAGAAIRIEENDLTPGLLAEEVLRILKSSEVYAKMSAAAGSLARPEAGRLLADLVLSEM
ncbi:MAG: undecaprenyldiphospho-muramoylpentapeptide beta-N-acetylglucosaminyltransferase [Candidatus Omnitrophica bacterium]|nr:undecaprenyldiphospho-muramoylpentapeptide beta-N-acetylglucosaminyltransferase [Candidatus Omnitrophota bacterium]